MRHWRVSEAARRDARTISPRAQSAQAALYHELKRQFNVTTNLELEYGPHGLGLFAPLGGSALATDTSPALLLRVPQGLALSPSISGCRGYSDAPASLRRLLSDGALPWEVTVGSLLLWACSSQRPPTDFYPQYRRLLPDADDQTSLLLFSAQELQQLQVSAGDCTHGGAPRTAAGQADPAAARCLQYACNTPAATEEAQGLNTALTFPPLNTPPPSRLSCV